MLVAKRKNQQHGRRRRRKEEEEKGEEEEDDDDEEEEEEEDEEEEVCKDKCENEGLSQGHIGSAQEMIYLPAWLSICLSLTFDGMLIYCIFVQWFV